MTRRQQIMEQVALIIQEGELSPEQADTINRTNGFTFDIRWHDGEYTRPTQWTRVEGEKLSTADLQAALSLADHWQGGG